MRRRPTQSKTDTGKEQEQPLKKKVKNTRLSVEAEVDKVQCGTMRKIAEGRRVVPANPAALTIFGGNQKPLFWGFNRRLNLTWFNNSRATSEDIQAACDMWNRVCGVHFKEVSSKEAAFIIVRDATQAEEADPDFKGVIAAAFFPGQLQRDVKIFRIFNAQPNRVSVLCHELGHSLGWRHEHIWVNPPWTTEGTDDATDLTAYDPDSIMNYLKLWGDAADGRVTTPSHLDGVGAQMVYGAPRDGWVGRDLSSTYTWIE